MLYAVAGKKDGAHVGLLLAKDLHEALEDFSSQAKVSKTSVIEAALWAFLSADADDQVGTLAAAIKRRLPAEHPPPPPPPPPAEEHPGRGRRVG